jgi:uncharacterized repeat protein (TIGR03806 family)
MKISNLKFLALLIPIIFLSSCSSNDDEYIAIPVSPVVMDLSQVPYPKLSDYKFFGGEMKNQTPSYGVIPFKPTSELFTDYALKKRFIWMPNGTKANYNGDGNILVLPVGAAIVKTFYYNNVQPLNTTQIIETRIQIHKSTGWIFVNYVWNSNQTEAFLQTQSSNVPISWIDENSILKTINYHIPSDTDCIRCHGNNTARFPIGIKPQNLNSNFNYSDGTKNQLTKLIEFGYLENNLPSSIVSVVDYKDNSKSLNLRVRSYFDINCAHCHTDGGEAEVYELRFAFNQTNVSTNMGVCLNANHQLVGYSGNIVRVGDVSQSILHYRMNTETDVNYRMPAIGRTIRHQEGVQLIEQWINSLTNCD